MIDYSPAGLYSNEVRAFAIIESGENPQAVGDGGQAYGLLQYHPATLAHWYARAQMSVSDTWEAASIKACAAFLNYFSFATASPEQQDLVIQSHNLGVAGVFADGRRNPVYLARWHQAYAAITKPIAWEGLDAVRMVSRDDG